MKKRHACNGASDTGWASKIWWSAERRAATTLREAMLLFASLLLALLDVAKTPPPGVQDAKRPLTGGPGTKEGSGDPQVHQGKRLEP